MLDRRVLSAHWVARGSSSPPATRRPDATGAALLALGRVVGDPVAAPVS